MDEQNRVDDTDRGDYVSELASERNIEHKDSIQSWQPGQPQYGQYSQQPASGQPNQPQPNQPWQPQYGQYSQQPASGQPNQPQPNQPWQPQYGQYSQQPAGGQPNQPQPNQPWRPQHGQYSQQPASGQPNQPQPNQPWQPQHGQYSQQPAGGQPNQPQYDQQISPYGNSMGYMGYEYRQDVKKGSTHVPNILNILGIIMAVAAVFLPYAYLDSDVRTISGVFGIDVLSIIIVAVLLIADIISAFVNKAAGYVIDLVISVVVAGAFIWEFVLALMDLGKLDASVHAGLSFGAWFSVVTALLLLISVPVWWMISRKKDATDKDAAEPVV